MYDSFRRFLLIIAGGAVALLLIGIGTAFAGDLRDSVVYVVCRHVGGEGDTIGSGTVISTTRILSASHVTDGCDWIDVTYKDDSRRLGVVKWHNVELDVAIIDVLIPTQAPVIKMATPILGEGVWAIGHPMGIRYVVTRGSVANIDEGGGWKILVDITGWHGMSGGPVLNWKREIVGVVSAGMVAGNRFNLEVPIGLMISVRTDSIMQQYREDLR